MRRLQKKSFVLLAGALLLLGGAFAASRHLSLRQFPAENRSANASTKSSAGTGSQQLSAQPAIPASTATIDRSVIAGGGGTSTGGSFRVDATIGEVGASNAQSGGSFTLKGGFWNLGQDQSASPTPTPTSSPSPSPSPTATSNVVQFSSANYSVQEDCTTVSIVDRVRGRLDCV